jgi:hypothetical protein
MILFRPVGVSELGLLAKNGFRRFPPPTAEKQAFCPMLAFDDARRVAEQSNTKDRKSGFAGFVTRFEVADDYVRRLEPGAPGGRWTRGFRVPLSELENFNRHIIGTIEIVRRYFGERFAG